MGELYLTCFSLEILLTDSDGKKKNENIFNKCNLSRSAATAGQCSPLSPETFLIRQKVDHLEHCLATAGIQVPQDFIPCLHHRLFV